MGFTEADRNKAKIAREAASEARRIFFARYEPQFKEILSAQRVSRGLSPEPSAKVKYTDLLAENESLKQELEELKARQNGTF